MKKSLFTLVCLSMLALIVAEKNVSAAADTTDKPNIIFILADDKN